MQGGEGTEPPCTHYRLLSNAGPRSWVLGVDSRDLPYERLAQYRLMAAQAHGRATDAVSPEVREFYVAIAEAWEVMATEVERAAIPHRYR